jgi:hypothetical protein
MEGAMFGKQNAQRAATAAIWFHVLHGVTPTPAQLGAILNVPERVARRRLDLAHKLGLYS